MAKKRKKSMLLLYIAGGMVYSFDKDLSDDRGFPQRNIRGNSDIPFRCVRR